MPVINAGLAGYAMGSILNALEDTKTPLNINKTTVNVHDGDEQEAIKLDTTSISLPTNKLLPSGKPYQASNSIDIQKLIDLMQNAIAYVVVKNDNDFFISLKHVKDNKGDRVVLTTSDIEAIKDSREDLIDKARGLANFSGRNNPPQSDRGV